MSDTWTILKILAWTREYLDGKGVENARLESEWMLCHALGLDRVGLYLNHDRPLMEQELATYRTMVSRRGRREPLQHILGSQEFCGLEFEVTRDVLVPRHDTEVLVEEALRCASAAGTVLDIGTGSGCIAGALARKMPDSRVTAIDISAAALEIARRNAERNVVRVEFLCGSLFEPVHGRIFDLIVSNPPYIPSGDIAGLEPEVREYDPCMALDGGVDGFDFYRAIIPAALCHLSSGGWLVLEVGVGQAKEVSAIFRATEGYGEPATARDAGRIDRVVAAQRKDHV